MVALLVARAAVDVATDQGASPLFYAAQFGHVEILKLLLRAKAEVDQAGICGGTPQVAAFQAQPACVDLLLAGGANVHHKGDDGLSALDHATDFKHTAVEAVLRAHIVKQEAEAQAEAAGK